MKNINNIQIVNDFFSGDEKHLLINQVNDEIGSFYLMVISYISKKKGFTLNINPNKSQQFQSTDLFQLKEAKIFSTNNSKEIDRLIDIKEKRIVICDYKNYKKYQSIIKCINGYEYKYDIRYFIKEILNIQNTDLLEYCLSYPQLIYSETSKYLTNEKNYFKEESISEKTNFILDIRKKIFSDRNSINIREKFLYIKDEAKYKKFSFLTY